MTRTEILATIAMAAAITLFVVLGMAHGSHRPECWDGSCVPVAPRAHDEARRPPPPPLEPAPSKPQLLPAWWRLLLAALRVRCLPMVLP